MRQRRRSPPGSSGTVLGFRTGMGSATSDCSLPDCFRRIITNGPSTWFKPARRRLRSSDASRPPRAAPGVVHGPNGHSGSMTDYLGPALTRLSVEVERILEERTDAEMAVSERCRSNRARLGVVSPDRLVTFPSVILFPAGDGEGVASAPRGAPADGGASAPAGGDGETQSGGRLAGRGHDGRHRGAPPAAAPSRRRKTRSARRAG